MTSPTIPEARRHLHLAVLLLDCHAPESLAEAVQHAERGAQVLREIRAASRVRGADVLHELAREPVSLEVRQVGSGRGGVNLPTRGE